MDSLFRKSDRLLANTQTDIIRDKMDEIHWNAQLISIMGAKGVGKSTLIKQYLKKNYGLGNRRILYCTYSAPTPFTFRKCFRAPMMG